MTELIGKQLGNYRLIRQLGHGGFGDVYLGQHVHLQRHAAIKVLRAHVARLGEEAFRGEAQRLVDLEHPHIVRVFDFGIESGISYLVMEYAPNGSLRERHPASSRLSLDILTLYVKHIADALQYVHERKLIHRDIKPANILLGSKNNLLLSDVGLAIMSHGADSFTLQQIAGTPTYMAPEQARGRATPASDQYSLGVMVYEWLCGVRPFEGNQAALAIQHERTPPPPLRSHVPSLSPALEEVVLTTLSKDEKRRFATVNDFAKAFALACQSISSGPLASSIVDNQSSTLSRLSARPASVDASFPPNIATMPPGQPSQPLSIISPSNPSLPPPFSASSFSHYPPSSPGISALYGPQPPHQGISHPDESSAPLSASGKFINKGRRLALTLLVVGIMLAASLILGSTILMSLAPSTTTPANSHSIIFRPTPGVTTTSTAQAKVTTTTLPGSTGSTLPGPTVTPPPGPTVTPPPGPTATLPPGPTVTPSVPQNPYPPHSGTLVLNDSLSDNSQGYNWDQSPQSPYCVFTGGAYHISGNQQGHFNDCFARGIPFSNIAYEVQMTIVHSGDNTSGGGIIFRSIDDANTLFYAFTINLDGSYTLFAQGSSRATNRLLAASFSSAIRTGLNQTNVIAAVANGSTISLYVNQQLILSLNDTTYSAGDIGLFAMDTGALVEAVFSNAKVWKL